MAAVAPCFVNRFDKNMIWKRQEWQSHLGLDENGFDSFFSPKMRKMEQIRLRRWSRRSRHCHGNEAMGRSAEPRSTRAGG